MAYFVLIILIIHLIVWFDKLLRFPTQNLSFYNYSVLNVYLSMLIKFMYFEQFNVGMWYAINKKKTQLTLHSLYIILR